MTIGTGQQLSAYARDDDAAGEMLEGRAEATTTGSRTGEVGLGAMFRSL